MTNPDYLDIHEAARMLNCSVATVRNRIRAGEVTPYRLGGKQRFFFKTSDLEKMARPVAVPKVPR